MAEEKDTDKDTTDKEKKDDSNDGNEEDLIKFDDNKSNQTSEGFWYYVNKLDTFNWEGGCGHNV